MAELTVWGAGYSVYSRILRLALAEKGVAYRFVETDVFDDPAARAAQAARHPFAKIPAMAHGAFRLYETAACLGYLEQRVFGDVRLDPTEPRARARSDQIAGLVDTYGYRAMIWQIWVETEKGAAGDPDVIAEGQAAAGQVLDAIEALAADGPLGVDGPLGANGPLGADGELGADGALAGPAATRGMLYLAAVLAYVARLPECAAAVAARPQVAAWWAAFRTRPSMAATRYPGEPAWSSSTSC